MISEPASGSRKIARSAALLLSIAAVYYVSARLGLALAFVNPSATAVWPAAGLALAAVLLKGTRVWPGIFLGAFLANLSTTGHGLSSFSIAAGNTAEACLGAILVNRWAGGLNVFESPNRVIKYILFAGVLSTAVSASVGAASLAAAGFVSGGHGAVWLTWWLGDAISNLVIAPFLIACHPDFSKWKRPSFALENLAFFAAVLLVTQFIFGGWLPGEMSKYPLEYLCLPILIWISFRYGLNGTTAAVLAMSVMAVVETLQGHSSFANYGKSTSLVLLQAFMGTAAVTGLILSSLLSQRKSDESRILQLNYELERRLEDLKQSEAQFRQLADRMPQIVWTARPDGHVDYFNHGWRMFTGVQGMEREAWSPVLHPDDHGRTIETWYDAVQSGENFEIEYRLRARDGSYSWFLGRAHPVKDEKGQLVRWIGTCTNIDEKKKTEGSLQQNVRTRTAQLLQKTRRLERFFRITVDREHEMIRLKREVNELLEKEGRPKKYMK